MVVREHGAQGAAQAAAREVGAARGRAADTLVIREDVALRVLLRWLAALGVGALRPGVGVAVAHAQVAEAAEAAADPYPQIVVVAGLPVRGGLGLLGGRVGLPGARLGPGRCIGVEVDAEHRDLAIAVLADPGVVLPILPGGGELVEPVAPPTAEQGPGVALATLGDA